MPSIEYPLIWVCLMFLSSLYRNYEFSKEYYRGEVPFSSTTSEGTLYPCDITDDVNLYCLLK